MLNSLKDNSLNNNSNLRILIIHSSWNLNIINNLLSTTINTLNKLHVSNITTKQVPGAFELPFAACKLHSDFDAIIAIGVLIKGQTMHFEYISDAVAHGLMNVGLEIKKPVIFGVLTCLNVEQAMLRAGMDIPKDSVTNAETGHDHPVGHSLAVDWAKAAVEMLNL